MLTWAEVKSLLAEVYLPVLGILVFVAALAIPSWFLWGWFIRLHCGC